MAQWSDDELGDADEPFIAPNIEQHGDAREQEEDGRSDTVDNSPTSAKQTDQEVFDATDVEGDEDEDEEGDDDRYEVEAITSHVFNGKRVLYEVKWKGYGEDENTFEPEANLLPAARDMLSKYHRRIGGDPQLTVTTRSKATPNQRRKDTNKETPVTNGLKKEAVVEEDSTWTPSRADWEPDVKRIDTISKESNGQLMAYIQFRNGKKTKVSMNMVRRHCPRPMLDFYEKHLKFN